MFCTNCGKENETDATFCIRCGHNLMENVSTNTQPSNYAGFWKRFAANLIDGLILGIIIGIPIYIITMLLLAGPMMRINEMQGGLGGGGVANDQMMQEVIFNSIMKAMVVNLILVFISTIINWLYFAIMESSSKQGTLGKMALGIIVTDLEGNRISFGKATGRYFGKILSGMIIYIGFIMVAFTEKKQGLHDMLAKTLVVNK